MNNDSERLQQIESHIAHLEHQVEQLNEVVVDQGKTIDRLKKEVQRQSSVLQTVELDRIKSNNPKPPHHG
jgi:SlyX protein